MKTNWLLTLTVFILLSFSDPYTIKRISDANFRYEFYVTEKVVAPQKNKIYYWFKGGAIHHSEAGIAGNLLNGEFTKMYHSNQLAEQGQFENGLKIGLWKTWHPNGLIETTQYWKNGIRKGAYNHFNAEGQLTEKGNYKADLKHGTWVDVISKDTVVYKKGAIYVKQPEVKKTIIPKEKKVENPKPTEKGKDKKGVKSTTSKTSKDNFFKRLFTKKSTNKKPNGQGT